MKENTRSGRSPAAHTPVRIKRPHPRVPFRLAPHRPGLSDFIACSEPHLRREEPTEAESAKGAERKAWARGPLLGTATTIAEVDSASGLGRALDSGRPDCRVRGAVWGPCTSCPSPPAFLSLRWRTLEGELGTRCDRGRPAGTPGEELLLSAGLASQEQAPRAALTAGLGLPGPRHRGARGRGDDARPWLGLTCLSVPPTARRTTSFTDTTRRSSAWPGPRTTSILPRAAWT